MSTAPAFVPGASSSPAEEFRRGWPVLLGSLVGVGIGGPGLIYYTWGVFLKELGTAWGWSRTVLSVGMLAFTLVLALVSPYVGGLIDRYGVRRPVALSLAAMALCYVCFYLFLDSLAAYFVLQLCLAVCCAASSSLAFTRVVSDWFDRSRGLALGVTLIGTGLGGALAPAYVSLAIADYGWRAGYLAIALVIVVAMPFVVWQVRLRQPPATERRPAGLLERDAAERDAMYRQARRSRTFWTLIAAFFIMAFGFTGLLVHFVPLLTDAGMSTVEAASVAGLIGIAVIAGRLVTGFCVDRFFAPYVAAAAISLSALGCLSLVVVGTAAAPVAAVAVGLAVGAEVDLIGFLTSRYFPMPIFGRVFGWQYGAFAIGNGLSPLWVAMAYDHFGSYRIALIAVAVLLVLAVAIFLTLPSYAGAGQVAELRGGDRPVALPDAVMGGAPAVE